MKNERNEEDHVHIRVTFDISETLAEVIRLSFAPNEHKLDKILRRLYEMPTQEEFDTQVAGINDKIDLLTDAVVEEAAQVQAFIAAHPELNTSALQGVADRLTALKDAVAAIDPDEVTPPTP